MIAEILIPEIILLNLERGLSLEKQGKGAS
jgi:hypothetical protein